MKTLGLAAFIFIVMTAFNYEESAMASSLGNEASINVATFGGGCFWCLEAIFEELEGVDKVVSGYSGGVIKSPSYRQICEGDTGHAEVVQIHFDPSSISYRELLTIFFSTHDPTTTDRQGADIGSQYRSLILYHDDIQHGEAKRIIADLEREGLWQHPIVTELGPLEDFYPAEEYHQDYFARNQDQPYCQAVISPKLAKFRKQFSIKLDKTK
jgi:peptide-methionine (S)-S-oxide reductase